MKSIVVTAVLALLSGFAFSQSVRITGKLGIGSQEEPILPLTVMADGFGLLQQSPDLSSRLAFHTTGNTANILTLGQCHLGFGTNNNLSLMTLTSYGYLGIGTTSPEQRLHVAGHTRVDGSLMIGTGQMSPDYPLVVRTGSFGITQESPFGEAKIGFYTSQNTAYIQTHNEVPMYFATNNSSVQMTLSTQGYLGIGTSTPAQPLHVNGNASINGNLTVQGTYGVVRNTTSNQVKIRRLSIGLGGTDMAPGATFTSGYLNFGESYSSVAVFVGNCKTADGQGGSWQKVLIVPCDVDTANNRCRFKYTNASSSTISFNASWEVVLIGT